MKSKRRADGPSANEIRQRSQLDVLRREIVKLKKQGVEDAGVPLADHELFSPDSALPADLQLEPEVMAPASPLLPVFAAAAGAPPLHAMTDASGGADAAMLRSQIEELSSAKQRLSRLYFNQLEENRKRAQKLHLILENISRINSELDLNALLDRVAATIRDSLGFRMVLIRMREAGTPRLRARAFAGVDDAARTQLENHDVVVDEFLSWLRDEFRVSHSYFISHSHPFNRTIPDGVRPELGARKEWEWHADDILFVPLFNRDQELVAYFSVDDPEDRLVPSREVVELLEIYGHHAVVAIENARLYRESERQTRELEEAQRLHLDMQQLKANFLSTVSHELRTPVTAIRAFVDTMLGAGYGEITHQQTKHFLTIINDESQRLSRLIESLLDLNQFDSGPIQSSRLAVDMAEVIQETMQLLEPVARVGRVTLKLEASQADTRVDASRDQMRQLALHLGNNAVKFTPPGGSVTFVLSGEGAEVGLEVIDSGIGIPREALERVFERFYQVDSSLVRRYGGTGLGLAICKSIVEHHGGRIHAESASEQGSRFVVRLPRRCKPRVVVQPGPEPEAAPADILRLAIEMVAEVMGARVVSLLCPEPDGSLVIRAAMGLEEDVVRRVRIEPGSGIAGWVAVNRRPVCMSGAEENPEVAGSGRTLYESRTFLSVPIEHDGRLLGVLNATDPLQQKQFDAEDCNLFLQLSQRIATAWRQALEAQQQQVGVADTANALRQVLRHLERGRRNAPDRVRLTRVLARELRLTEDDAGMVSFAASIHDVGMRSVGEAVTEGSGGLTAGEREQVERHPEAGAEMLSPLETAGGVRELVLSHHEWWNGSGYPRGIKGEAIPMGSRILAVVDAFESMTVGRSHRPAISRADALREIERLSGTQFDPQVVSVLPRALEQLDPQHGPEAAASTNPILAIPLRR